MADGVHPLMHPMQPTRFQPMANRPTAESEGGQLCPGDDAVLVLGQRRNFAVDRVRVTFGPHDGLNCSLV
jgi:hypothetical protein